MAPALVAADASPLIGLAAAGAFDVLRRMFPRLVVTEEVRNEVLAGTGRPGAFELEDAVRNGWITVVSVPDASADFPELGPGEASTLAFAAAHEGECLVLMDEPFGRARARQLDVPVTGLAGVLLAAKQAELVGSVRPYFQRLAATNFRVADEIMRSVLEAAGEAE
jgi:predicted nucleic acid-binding protein